MQKINFQKLTDKTVEEIKNLPYKPKLLLQACCGPCGSYVINYLAEFFDVTVFFCNSNIYPESEYFLRLEQVFALKEKMPSANSIKIVDAGYRHEEFLKAAEGFEKEREGGARCEKCFLLRLEKTAEYAAEKGFDFFGTTLTVSPHKNAELINSIGEKLQNKHKVKFLFSDFKKREGYKQSVELSKKYGLYRQEYCGCEFSLTDNEKTQ